MLTIHRQCDEEHPKPRRGVKAWKCQTCGMVIWGGESGFIADFGKVWHRRCLPWHGHINLKTNDGLMLRTQP